MSRKMLLEKLKYLAVFTKCKDEGMGEMELRRMNYGMKKKFYICRHCGKRYSAKQAYEKEIKLDGCRYYCSYKCCAAAYPSVEPPVCPCF
ncbi:MAG: hypothetical protein QW334_00150 [Thermofilum sp.]